MYAKTIQYEKELYIMLETQPLRVLNVRNKIRCLIQMFLQWSLDKRTNKINKFEEKFYTKISLRDQHAH